MPLTLPPPSPYRYATDNPADGWMKEDFDDQAWRTGLAPFGNDQRKRTEWTGPDLYCRKTFEFDGRKLKHASLVLSNNGRTEVWLNGRKILGAEASRTYRMHVLTEVLRDTLRKGTNTIAV